MSMTAQKWLRNSLQKLANFRKGLFSYLIHSLSSECIWWNIMVKMSYNSSSIQFTRSVVSDSLRHHGLQHARLPCPSPTPEACSNSCPLSQWCHPAICCPLLPSVFPSIRVFSSESAVRISWPKYWSSSFSIRPSNEYSGLISPRIDWFDLSQKVYM